MNLWTLVGVVVQCTLGDPKGENIIVPGFILRKVHDEEAKAKGAQKLALLVFSLRETKWPLVCVPNGREGNRHHRRNLL